MADRELGKLAKYMVHITTVNDFRTLEHKVGSVESASFIEWLIAYIFTELEERRTQLTLILTENSGAGCPTSDASAVSFSRPRFGDSRLIWFTGSGLLRV